MAFLIFSKIKLKLNIILHNVAPHAKMWSGLSKIPQNENLDTKYRVYLYLVFNTTFQII